MSVIEVTNLSKNYRTFDRRDGVWGSVKDLFSRDYRTIHAVDDVSFAVEEGELVGYIGPNGAGKSTSIKMLTGILKPTSGEMKVLGFHPFRDRREYTRHIGVVFGQRTQLWWDIAVIESFRLLARIYRVPDKEFQERLDQLCDILALEGYLRTPVRKLSLGERMRCDLAASLLHSPRLLFFDEPTIGLDAVAKDKIREFLRKVNRESGATIILTTHDLNEIEELCERILVLDKGKIVYDGSQQAIKALPGLKRSLVVDFPGQAPIGELKNMLGGQVSFSQQGERRVFGHFDPQVTPTADVVRELVSAYNIADLTVSEPSIEEVIRKIYRDGVA